MQRFCDEMEIEIETAHIVEDAEAGEGPGGVGGVP